MIKPTDDNATSLSENAIPSNNVGDGAIAGTGITPSDYPPVMKKKKRLKDIIRRVPLNARQSQVHRVNRQRR